MAEIPTHTWTCPSCGRRVPLRAEACHCGMTRARAEELAVTAAAAAAEVPVRPTPGRGVVDRREAVAAMTTDVKALVVAGALVVVVGLGWMAFGPHRPDPTPPVLGYVDQGPPPVPKPVPSPRPPFKLPWWR